MTAVSARTDSACPEWCPWTLVLGQSLEICDRRLEAELELQPQERECDLATEGLSFLVPRPDQIQAFLFRHDSLPRDYPNTKLCGMGQSILFLVILSRGLRSKTPLKKRGLCLEERSGSVRVVGQLKICGEIPVGFSEQICGGLPLRCCWVGALLNTYR